MSLLGRGSCFRVAKSFFFADSRKLFVVVVRPPASFCTFLGLDLALGILSGLRVLS